MEGTNEPKYWSYYHNSMQKLVSYCIMEFMQPLELSFFLSVDKQNDTHPHRQVGTWAKITLGIELTGAVGAVVVIGMSEGVMGGGCGH